MWIKKILRCVYSASKSTLIIPKPLLTYLTPSSSEIADPFVSLPSGLDTSSVQM